MKYLKIGIKWFRNLAEKNPGIEYYSLMKAESKVITYVNQMDLGEIVLICDGFMTIAVAKVTSVSEPCTNDTAFMSKMKQIGLPTDSSNLISNAKIYEIPENFKFQCKIEQGMCFFHKPEYIQKVNEILAHLDLNNSEN